MNTFTWSGQTAAHTGRTGHVREPTREFAKLASNTEATNLAAGSWTKLARRARRGSSTWLVTTKNAAGIQGLTGKRLDRDAGI